MYTTGTIVLRLTARGIDAYCHELARLAPGPEKRIATLDALLTFVSTQADPGERAKADFAAVRQTLLGHLEQAREALLRERAARLHRALDGRRLPELAAMYNALSRDAFWALLGRIEPVLERAALESLRGWVADWMTGAWQRARQAGACPDAIDFAAAGIDVAEFVAMTDLGRYLGVDPGTVNAELDRNTCRE